MSALERLDGWLDPDVVGSSEYRAIHDCLTDAEAHDPELAIAMLDEFIAHAEAMKKCLTDVSCRYCSGHHERVPEDLCDLARGEYDRAGALGRSLGLED